MDFTATISLYEFVVIIGLLLLALAQQNLFVFIFVVFAVGKAIPEKLTKYLIKSPRPPGAMDCNMINQGGKATANGFPSGHTTIATFIFVYTLYECLESRLWGPIVATGLFFILIPIARIQRKCHTPAQVVGGVVYGVTMAILFILLEKHALMRIPRYRADKQRFVNSFS
jgi:membrane-associated phospholipid phosphatase